MLLPEKKVALAAWVFSASQDYSSLVKRCKASARGRAYISFPCWGYIYWLYTKRLEGGSYNTTALRGNDLALNIDVTWVFHGVFGHAWAGAGGAVEKLREGCIPNKVMTVF